MVMEVNFTSVSSLYILLFHSCFSSHNSKMVDEKMRVRVMMFNATFNTFKKRFKVECYFSQQFN